MPKSSNTADFPFPGFGIPPADPAARIKWLLDPGTEELEALNQKCAGIARLCIQHEFREADEKLARTDPALDPVVREALAWRHALAQPDLRIFLDAQRTLARELARARRPRARSRKKTAPAS